MDEVTLPNSGEELTRIERIGTHSHRDSRARLVKRAIESASQYNMYLNKQRRFERSVYMDLQTDTVNYPVGLGRQNKTLKKTNKIGRYPVALLPCQYQDWYVTYTSEEMKYLPVNTVLLGPIVNPEKLPPVLSSPETSDFSDSDSDSSCSSNDSHSTHGSCSNSNCDSNNEDNDNASLLSGSSSNSSHCSSCENKKRRKKVTIQWSRTPSPPHLVPIEEEYAFQAQYLHQ